MLKSKKILFCVSGSISAYKAADVVSKLMQRGHEVQVVFSPSAEKFVGESTFEGLTGRKVLTDMFEAGRAMEHIHLARWADLLVLCPASAGRLSELYSGSANDLISTLFLAKADLLALIFPAMNSSMWEHPFVKRNQEALSKLPNTHVIPPSSGALACGERGVGRLPEPSEILQVIERHLKESKSDRRRVLVTGGGTSEPIDSVRSITNTSSGETACRLADHFQKQGFHVDLLLSKTARFQPNHDVVDSFTAHSDLEEKLKTLLSKNNYTGIVHLAAVSDFAPDVQLGKISSDTEKLQLELKPTRKIIRSLREWSKNKETKIIGFKLTVSANEAERENFCVKQIKENQLDAVVSNDLSEISSTEHSGFVFLKDGTQTFFKSKDQLAQNLIEILEDVR